MRAHRTACRGHGRPKASRHHERTHNAHRTSENSEDDEAASVFESARARVVSMGDTSGDLNAPVRGVNSPNGSSHSSAARLEAPADWKWRNRYTQVSMASRKDLRIRNRIFDVRPGTSKAGTNSNGEREGAAFHVERSPRPGAGRTPPAPR